MNKTRSPRTIILLLIRTFLLTASVLLLTNLTVIQAQINPPTCTKVRLPGPNLRAFLDTLVPGDVGCLRAGVHGARGTEAYMTVSGTQASPITLKGYPGEAMPTIVGYFPIGGSNIVISGVLFDGPTGLVNANPPNPPAEISPIAIYGSNVEINRCEIRNSLSRAGIYLQNAYNTRLIGNYIHDNGNFTNPSFANLDHGIYFGSGSGLIANNLIERNYAFGVHLYPSASNVIVQQNTIVRNGRSGVIIGGWTTNCPAAGCPPQPTNNLVVNNIIAFNAYYAFQSFELTTSGHIIKNNLLWGNAGGDIPSDERLTRGLTFVNQNNNIADPRFVGAFNYRLQSGSPAIDAALNPYTQPDDYDFIPRPQGAASDIGAFEFIPTTPPTPTPMLCTPFTTVSEGDLFPGGLPSFGVSSGPGSVTIDHVNAGTGTQSITVVGVPVNATANIPAYTPGTFAPVVVTFTRPNSALAVDFTLRAASTFHAANIRVRCLQQ